MYIMCIAVYMICHASYCMHDGIICYASYGMHDSIICHASYMYGMCSIRLVQAHTELYRSLNDLYVDP